MKNEAFANLLERLTREKEVVSIEVTGWQETGEYDGEDPRPTLIITKKIHSNG